MTLAERVAAHLEAEKWLSILAGRRTGKTHCNSASALLREQRAEITRLRETLREIRDAYHEHMECDEEWDSGYADGTKDQAETARKALEQQP